ncbi:MAG: YgiT-type zinc finger protein [Pirellulales bacterium]|nr:YgiT-type zinc finger protein [Pirellulales bacterium]
MYDFLCEHCTGAVRERRLDREAIRHKGGFVILENVPIGVCDTCGARYFHASVLRRVAEVGRRTTSPLRTIAVPVDAYMPLS